MQPMGTPFDVQVAFARLSTRWTGHPFVVGDINAPLSTLVKPTTLTDRTLDAYTSANCTKLTRPVDADSAITLVSHERRDRRFHLS